MVSKKYAILLCGGRGKRMFHYTKNKPKCMLKVATDLTIIDIIIQNLQKHDYKPVLATGNLSDLLEKYVLSRYDNCDFTFNPIYSKTNSIYTLYLTKDYIFNSSFVINSDCLFHDSVLNLFTDENVSQQLIKKQQSYDEDCWKVVEVEGRIIDQGKDIKCPSNLKVSGVYIGVSKIGNAKIFKKKMAEMIVNDRLNEFCTTVYRELSYNYLCRAIHIGKSFYHEIDTIQDYEKLLRNGLMLSEQECLNDNLETFS